MKTDQTHTQFHEFPLTEHDQEIRMIWELLAERDDDPDVPAQLIGLCLAALSGALMGSAIMYAILR